jgi:transposase
MRRFELTDAQWEQIAPLLPPQQPRMGRPAEDHRQVLDGVHWILRTGAPWEDLPARYGPAGTVLSRFYRWRKAGVRPGSAAPARAGGCARRPRLGSALRERHGGARPPARRRCTPGPAPSGGGRRRSRAWMKRSGAARAASPPSCICVLRAAAGRSRRRWRLASATSSSPWML